MSLNGCRILLTEDEALIAHSLADYLTAAGAHVCGPYPSAAGAIRDGSKLDVAVLDLSLLDGMCTPLAEDLVERGIPIIIATGYANLAPGFRPAAIVYKPYAEKEIETAIRLVLRRAA